MPSEVPIEEGRNRVVITNVYPEIDCGRFPIKRTPGEKVVVEADIFADGHDQLGAVVLYREERAPDWNEAPMRHLANDRWRGEFEISHPTAYRYSFQAWVDHFKTWVHDLAKRVDAGQDVTVDLLIGAELVKRASRSARDSDRRALRRFADALRSDVEEATRQAFSPELAALMERYADRRLATTYERELPISVDRERARFSTWYELFPRSCSGEPGRHGTFKDCEGRLPDLADMGFDVVYFPPIHPIGTTHRKGKNNSLFPEPTDPGSPWAIGSQEGGHKAIHPQLGTMEDFERFVNKAREHGLEVALDLAFQCSPDHPYVSAHPEWFHHRPDGTIQYAENPPKKYQDIYPINFETPDWKNLWVELKSVVTFWAGHGVRIFRVDNPHTKPFRFWEWLIGEVKREYPDALFLSEAFTRPKVMYHLAKLGFTQSYTYFTWRNTKWELIDYFTELTHSEVREYFRPNLWPNTPDILHEYLQVGGRPAFIARLVLAATLSANYGIYGPAFELMENRPREKGSEEYLNSEKYEIRTWDLHRPDSLRGLISRVNHIRKENPALQHNGSLHFHSTDNDQIICYSKNTADHTNVILVVVNLDPFYTQAGWVDLALETLGLELSQTYQVHDLLNEATYTWHGAHNYVELNPQGVPAHIFRLQP